MTRRQNLWVLLALAGAVIALVVLTSGLAGIELQPGRPLPRGDPQLGFGRATLLESSLLGALWRVFWAIVVFVLLPIFLIFFVFSPSFRRQALKRILWGLAITACVYLMLRVSERLSLPRPTEAEAPPRGTEVPAASPGELPGAVFVADPPQWLVITLSLALAAAIIGLVWWIARRRPRAPEPATLGLAQEAEEALAELRAGGDLRDTILRCYQEMSRVLSAGRGLERQSSMTPREFEQQLAAAGVRDEHVRRLTRLFEGVRYGARRAGERDKLEAQDCLAAIVRAYGGSA